MTEIDWHEIKFLESSSNLKKIIKVAVGREPSTQVGNEIAVCIQQGRLFFEAAASAPREIRPLQLFYGVLGFAKGLSIAREVCSLNTLPHSHGVSATSSHASTLEQLSLKLAGTGTFQRFNDVVAPLGSIHYYDGTMPTSILMPFSSSNELQGTEASLREILARVPMLQDLYEKTFGQSAKCWRIELSHWPEYSDTTELRIDDPSLFGDRDSLRALVSKWRDLYPFLNQWCLSEASVAWGNSILIFSNIVKDGIDEFSSDFLHQFGESYSADVKGHPEYHRQPFSTIIQPIAGGMTRGQQYVAQPIDEKYICEYSLQYLGSFLLSSLVRYRPQVWQHAISRSVLPQLPADDKALALVEMFLEIVLQEFPPMVVQAIAHGSDDG